MSAVSAIVPATDAELFSIYYPHIKFLVQRAGIRSDYVEDYSMELMEKLLKKGLLAQYDPNHKSAANFKTLLSNFCSAYLRHYMERDAKHAQRSALSTDISIKNDDTENGVPLLDFLGISEADKTDEAEASELVENVRKVLLTKHTPVMNLFFEMVLLQVEEHGQVDVAEMSEMFGVARQTIFDRLKKLRKVFEQCM